MARSPADLEGTRFGIFEVAKRLGQGAMGAVYRARAREAAGPVAAGSLVALKVLRADLAGDESGRTRFVREARSAARIDHPNCCRFLGTGEAEGLQWLALELVEGETLDRVLKVRGAFTPAESVGFVRQLLLGLEAAHAAGVVHRDVKPANAVLTPSGVLKLVDFGLARRADESLVLTVEGAVLGTPHYMAPEQCSGETVDHRADLYAVGIIAFQLVTGRTPFQAPTLLALLKKHVEEPVPPLRNFKSDAPAALDRFVQRLLKKDREDRYPDAAAALRALDQVGGQLERGKSARQPAEAPRRESGRLERPPAAPGGGQGKPAPARPASRPAASARRDPQALALQVGVSLATAALAAVVLLFVVPRIPPVARRFPGGLPPLLTWGIALAGGVAVFRQAASWSRRALEAQGVADASLIGARAEGPRETVAAARELSRKGDHVGAAASFRRLGLVEDAARELEAAGDFRSACDLLRELERWPEAAALAEKAQDLPRAVELWKKAGDLDGAVQALERAGQKDEAARLLAERAAELESRRASEQLPARLARIDAELAVVVERASKLFQATGAPQEGARLLARIGRHRDAAELYLAANDRAQAVSELLAAGETERAAQVHERAGDVVAAARIRAEESLARDDKRTAAAELERAGDFLRAARLFEDLGELALAAELHERAGELARAAGLFERAQRPMRGGEIYERLGQLRDAARCFREAKDARREAAALARSEDFHGAGIALLNGGHEVEALAELRRVPAGSPHFEDARTRIRALEDARASSRPAAPSPARAATPEARAATPAPSPAAPRPGAPRPGPPPARPGPPSARVPAAHSPAAPSPVAPLTTQAPPEVLATDEPGTWLGRTLDRYRVTDHLGSGAFAHVFRAVHVHLDRPVALKVLRPVYAAQPAVAGRFLEEARVVSRLKHPGLVEVHDFGRAGDSLYMALELVEGPTLRQVLAARTTLPPGEALGLARGILEAVHAAHKAGVVHRDLKPENVLVDRDGKVRVLDFGMAKVFWGVVRKESAGGGSTTSFAGTPRYASPEAATGSDVDARSDQYAAGLILFELLTGDLPFRSESPTGWLNHHAHTVPPPPSSRRPGLGPAIDALVLRALEKSPERRYPSAASFAEAARSTPASASL